MSDRPNGNGNGDRVPVWMAELGVKEGEWLDLSKAQLRTLQRPGKPLKVQVWATGMLHSSGYKNQQATTMRNGKKVPLAPGDIIAELWNTAKQYYSKAGIKATDKEWLRLKETKEDLRQALQDLEGEGVAERTDTHGTPIRQLPPEKSRRLPSGHTRMFFWLIPRAPEPADVVRQWERLKRTPITADEPNAEPEAADENQEVGIISLPMPPIWQVLKGLKIPLPEKAQTASPDYQKKVERAWAAARKVFLEVVNESLPEATGQVGADSPLEVGTTAGAFESKAERKDVLAPSARPSVSAIDKKQSSSSSAFVPSSPEPPKAEEEDHRSLYQIFKTQYPAAHFDEPATKPAFARKSKAEQRRILERLEVYLDCDRWKDQDGQWIPFSSKWLESCEADPPPVMRRKTTTKSATKQAIEDFMAAGGGEN